MLSGARLVTLIPIRSMNRAIEFYTGSMGGKLLYRGQGEMKNFWASVKIGKDEIWLINPPKRDKRKLAYNLFMVKDIKKAVASLKKKRVKFERAEKSGPDSKAVGAILFESFGASAFFKDTEGNLLMLWQNSPAM